VDDIRNISCQLGCIPNVDGSCYFEMGLTKVLCVVKGPHEPTQFSNKDSSPCELMVDIDIVPFASPERVVFGKTDRKLTEMKSAIKQSIQSILLLQSYVNSQISIYLTVIQADNNEFSSCINATTLALIDAGIQMRDYLISVSLGYLERTIVVDPNDIESSAPNYAELTLCILPKYEKISFTTMIRSFPTEILEKMLAKGIEIAKRIQLLLRAKVKEQTRLRLITRGLA
jgi:exosome complex component RRP41